MKMYRIDYNDVYSCAACSKVEALSHAAQVASGLIFKPLKINKVSIIDTDLSLKKDTFTGLRVVQGIYL